MTIYARRFVRDGLNRSARRRRAGIRAARRRATPEAVARREMRARAKRTKHEAKLAFSPSEQGVLARSGAEIAALFAAIGRRW